MQFTPGQLRAVASITPETYRHWKKALMPLRRDCGHSPCFTSGDLLAVAVVRVLSVELALRVSALAPIANALFERCNASPWAVLERGKLVFDIRNGQLHFQSEHVNPSGESAVVSVPLRPIVTQLRNQLLADTEYASQQELRFPPPPLASSSTPAATGSRS
jgi:hypothetical protein